MARTIPEETIAEIKSRADLADIVGKVVKLKRVGRNLVGLCPFHTEKSPSFNVRPDEGFFYCFGCKAAGDVVTFLEKTTGRGFLDIVTDLAAQTGVELPKVDIDPVEEERQRARKRLLRALELAQVFFRTRLQSDEGRPARTYLADVRKIDDAAVDAFGLGFGGARDDGLATFLKEQGVAEADAIAAGVVAKQERGPYDFFRHRITIPIRGARGEVLSFQGRIFGEREVAPDGTKRPKYVNGPQTAIYDKSVALFGLFESQPALKRGQPAVLVEGPLDAIAVHRCGVPSAVAPCGSALTPRHIDEIKRRTEKLIVCMDSDQAGKDAAARSILMALQAGLDVSLVALPDKDPDSLAQSGRMEELKRLVLEAPGALDALVSRSRAQATGSMQARVKALEELLPFLAAPQRDLVRSEAIRTAARAFGEDEALIASEVQKRGRKLLSDRLRGLRLEPQRAPQRQAPPAEASGAMTASGTPAPSSAAPAPVARPRAPAKPLSEPEIMLVEALLTHPHLAARCGVLVPALRNAELRSFIERLVGQLVRYHDEDPRTVLRKVPMQRDGQIRGLLLKLNQADGFSRPDTYLPESAAVRIIDDAIMTLDRRHLELRLGELMSLLGGADERADHGERKRLLAEQAAVVDALKALDNPHPKARPGALALPVTNVLAALPAASTMAIPGTPPDEHEGAPAAALTAQAATPANDDVTKPPGPAGEDGGGDDGDPGPGAPFEGEPPWAGEPDDDPWAV